MNKNVSSEQYYKYTTLFCITIRQALKFCPFYWNQSAYGIIFYYLSEASQISHTFVKSHSLEKTIMQIFCISHKN